MKYLLNLVQCIYVCMYVFTKIDILLCMKVLKMILNYVSFSIKFSVVLHTGYVLAAQLKVGLMLPANCSLVPAHYDNTSCYSTTSTYM